MDTEMESQKEKTIIQVKYLFSQTVCLLIILFNIGLENGFDCLIHSLITNLSLKKMDKNHRLECIIRDDLGIKLYIRHNETIFD